MMCFNMRYNKGKRKYTEDECEIRRKMLRKMNTFIFNVLNSKQNPLSERMKILLNETSEQYNEKLIIEVAAIITDEHDCSRKFFTTQLTVDDLNAGVVKDKEVVVRNKTGNVFRMFFNATTDKSRYDFTAL